MHCRQSRQWDTRVLAALPLVPSCELTVSIAAPASNTLLGDRGVLAAVRRPSTLGCCATTKVLGESPKAPGDAAAIANPLPLIGLDSVARNEAGRGPIDTLRRM